MKFTEVTRYKQELIIKCPIYFSNTLVDFVRDQHENEEILFHALLILIIGSIYGRNINGDSACIAYMERKKIVPVRHQFIVFSANLESEECIVCIQEIDTKKFNNSSSSTEEQRPIYIGKDVFTAFEEMEDILLLEPFLKKSRLQLKSFFLREQGEEVVQIIGKPSKGHLN